MRSCPGLTNYWAGVGDTLIAKYGGVNCIHILILWHTNIYCVIQTDSLSLRLSLRTGEKGGIFLYESKKKWPQFFCDVISGVSGLFVTTKTANEKTFVNPVHGDIPTVKAYKPPGGSLR